MYEAIWSGGGNKCSLWYDRIGRDGVYCIGQKVHKQ